MKRLLLLYLLSNFVYSFCQEKNTKIDSLNSQNSIYIDLSEFEINKHKVNSKANLDFKNAIIVDNLDFYPNKDDFNNFYKSSYNGKVKQVTVYKKNTKDSYKRFDRMDKFNIHGYLIESEYTYAGNLYYSYDSNNNLIKEVKVRDGDTIRVKNIYYNDNGKIEKIKENYLKEKKDYEYNLDILIEYDSEGRPSKIINNNPKKKYTKEISYKNNQVIIFYKSNTNSKKEIYTYSNKFKLLEEENQNHTIINKYDESDRLFSSMTYRDQEYCCTDFYNRNENGFLINRIFTNHLKNHKEITTYKYEFDDFKNIIFEFSSNNIIDREYETYYEIEYFE
jgi:hypothetical protein